MKRNVELSSAARKRLGDRLKELSRQRDVSLSQLAQDSGVGVSTVLAISRGEAEPNLSMMLAFVSVLRLRSIEELLASIGTPDFCVLEGRPLP